MMSCGFDDDWSCVASTRGSTSSTEKRRVGLAAIMLPIMRAFFHGWLAVVIAELSCRLHFVSARRRVCVISDNKQRALNLH